MQTALKKVPSVTPSSGERLSPIKEARRVLDEQICALRRLGSRLDDRLQAAIQLIVASKGRVVVTGVGKSGLIGRKIAATLSSMGTPAVFMHPVDALHGDLGMVVSGDVVIAISNSGATEEVLKVLPFFEDANIPVVALVGRFPSPLASRANVALDVSVDREACALNLAPTTSTLATLAMGDVLAICLAKSRAFGAADFARVHPAGNLGRILTMRVRDLMRSTDLPFVHPQLPVRECLLVMTEGRCGIAIVVDHEGCLAGVLTDGDLRRGLLKNPNLMDCAVEVAMTPEPVTIWEGATMKEAEEKMSERRIKALIVQDVERSIVGLVEYPQLS